MKICTRCKISKKEIDFGKNENFKNGLNSWCRKCCNKYSHDYKINNREKCLESARIYRKKHSVESNLFSKSWRKNSVVKRQKAQKEFRNKYPNSHNAEMKVSRRIRSGEIVVPGNCQKCNSTDKLYAHHHNGYEPPHEIDVVFLCQSCHQLEHRRKKTL